MGSFERFTTKTHFNSLKRQVLLAALLMLAVKLLVTALGAPPDGSWPDLLARVPPNVADVGAAVLVFEVLRTRRAANRAARSAVLVAASPVLFVASGVHGDPAGVAVALLLLGTYLLVDHDAPLAAGIAVGVAARVDPLVLLAAPVALALAPAFSPRQLVWPVVFGYLGDARWASIYNAVAGATLLWAAAWWGPGLPWDGGVAPDALPAGGRGAVLGLATWLVLAAWAAIGWRTVALESRPRGRHQPAARCDPAPAPGQAAPAHDRQPPAPTRALAPPGGS